MAVVLKCPIEHTMQNSVDDEVNFQCVSCGGHIEARSLHMACAVSGCMHRICVQCMAAQSTGHKAKKMQT
eukprot:7985224-Karenia_brevis.AAC.1